MTIVMKYHTLFVIFEKAAKFEIVVCCKLKVVLYGLKINPLALRRIKVHFGSDAFSQILPIRAF